MLLKKDLHVSKFQSLLYMITWFNIFISDTNDRMAWFGKLKSIYSNVFKKEIIKNYNIIDKIGEGSFGIFYKAQRDDGQVVVLKEIKEKPEMNDLEKYIKG